MAETQSPPRRTQLKIERTTAVSPWKAIAYRLLAIMLALLVLAGFVQSSGMSASEIAATTITSTFGTRFGLEQLGVLATPLILAGIAVYLALQMKLFNVGVEGQIFMGAWAGAAVGLHIEGPAPAILLLMFIAGALAGAFWAFIPAILRIRAGVSEVLTTILLNFVAIHWVTYWSRGPWWDPSVYVLSATAKIPYELPILSGRLHLGILIAVALAVLAHFALKNTAWGYEVSTIGENRRAAEFSGMPVLRHMLTVMLASGALGGVAGVIEVAGTVHRLSSTISQSYGFLGLIVAVLAGGFPLALVPAGFLMAAILNAGVVFKTQGLSFNIVLAFTGLLLFLVAVGEIVSSYRISRQPIGRLEPPAVPEP